jgi:hypothetical protein
MRPSNSSGFTQQYKIDSLLEVPLEGVVKPGWRDFIRERDPDGLLRVNRLSYELCVLAALRERLRCRELWVVGANKCRNPEEGLPADFPERRDLYFALLKQPLQVEALVTQLQRQMAYSTMK